MKMDVRKPTHRQLTDIDTADHGKMYTSSDTRYSKSTEAESNNLFAKPSSNELSASDNCHLQGPTLRIRG